MAATVHAAIVQVRAVTQIGGSALVPNSTSVGPVQVLTENTASTIVAAVHDRSATDYGDVSSSPEYMVWEITNFGPDNIYVAFGTTPDATATAVTSSATTAKRAVAAGTTRWFGVAKLGDKVEYVLA